ncbi:GNAT family N-acetyltransferase [Bdellovibrio sp. HCB209]|uniref:GNAT family N-acetyltransferase n=1 Tax=Bdellovibrio sp. HCB209 TaxID=3394354 RepID=UPI0039B5925B
MSSVRIQHLYEVPALIPEVAQWIFNAFWSDKGLPDSSFLVEALGEATSSDAVPLSLVAFIDDKAVGTINLIENDDEERTHLTPWLAALWVDPKFRKQGIGSQLVLNLLAEAKRLGISELYLETHSPKFYTDLGAELIEEISPNFFLLSFKIS